MATKTKNAATKSGAKKPAAPAAKDSASRLPVLIGIVVAVIVVAFGAAIIASRGDDADSAQTGDVEVSGAALPALPEGGDDPAMGLLAPNVSGTDFDGSAVAIDPGDGAAKLVVFLAHWCPHCQAEVPVIAPYLAGDEKPEGLEVVAVSTAVSDARDNYPPQEWLEREGWPSPVIRDDGDNSAANAYGLTAYPYYVVIDEEGAVVGRDSGEMAIEDFDQFLRDSLGE
jgi:cytochrome c biogenesis protein CcmG, thiol:disulfide interchange protein DsbE